MARFIKRDTDIFSKTILQKFDLSGINLSDAFLVVANNSVALLVKDKRVTAVKKPGTYRLCGMDIDSVFISQEFYDHHMNRETKKPIALTFPGGEFILFKFWYYITMNWKGDMDESILRITNFNDVTEDDLLDYLENVVSMNTEDIFRDFDSESLRDNYGNYANGYLIGDKLFPFLKETLASLGLYANPSVDMVTINDPSFYDEINENEDKKEEKPSDKSDAAGDFFGNVIRDAIKATSDSSNNKTAEENLDAAILKNLFGGFFGNN